jgi:hypothetical protein
VAAAHGLFAELARRLRATPAEVIAQRRVRVPATVKARIVTTAAVSGRVGHAGVPLAAGRSVR